MQQKNKNQIFAALVAVFISVALVTVAVYATTTVGDNVSIGGDLTVAGNATTSGNQIVSGELAVTRTSTFSGNIGIGYSLIINLKFMNIAYYLNAIPSLFVPST